MSGCTFELAVTVIMTDLHNKTEAAQSSFTTFKLYKINITDYGQLGCGTM